MHIVNHPLCTNTIYAPADIRDDSRAQLPVMLQTDPHGRWITSFWQPSADELESIINGGGVALHIKALAHQHPFVSVATWPAIGPVLIDGDSFIKSYASDPCSDCSANEGQPHTEQCSFLASAIQFAQSKLTQDWSSCGSTGRPLLSYPPTLSAVLLSPLTSLGLYTSSMVKIFRAAGYKVARQCAAEEAFILDRIIRTVLYHGDKWVGVFITQLRVAQDIAIEKHKAAEQKNDPQTNRNSEKSRGREKLKAAESR
jgi:hypothetical protein